MSNDNIMPVNHSATGSAVQTVAGAGGGALKGGFLTAALWIGGLTVLGALALPAITALGTGGIVSGLSTVFTSSAFWGAGLGLAAGLLTWQIPTIIGAGIGAFHGGGKAISRVGAERSAAQAMQMEMAAQMQPPTITNQYMNSVSPDEMALLNARLRGGNGVRSDFGANVQASREAAATPSQAANG